MSDMDDSSANKRESFSADEEALLQKLLNKRKASKRAKTVPFDVEHLQSVQSEASNFKDYSGSLSFTGRIGFARSLASGIRKVASQLSRSTAGGFDIKSDRGTAWVYSTVSGSGKTRCMLELQNTLPEALSRVGLHTNAGAALSVREVKLGYAGFNSGLGLTTRELEYITEEVTAEEVLWRRIVGSVLVSQKNPTNLPRVDKLYAGLQFPSVYDLMDLFVKYINPPKDGDNALAVVVIGIDEVQAINRSKTIGEGEGRVGLGRLFLRLARQIQVKLLRHNILVVPVGTGVTLDFRTDGSTGDNSVLYGHEDDIFLISKSDFRDLAAAKYESEKEGFVAQYGDGTEETVLDKVAALWWPRVRLIEMWTPHQDVGWVPTDGNISSWKEWLHRWMLDETFSVKSQLDIPYIPGKSPDGKENDLRAVFELAGSDELFKVIPDFVHIRALVDYLMVELQGKTNQASLSMLYRPLKLMSSLDPQDHTFDSEGFEKFGFHVIGASLYLGTKLLSSQDHLAKCITPVREKRLGLARWVHGELPDFDPEEVSVLGVDMARKSPYFPFTSHHQNEFEERVARILSSSSTYNAVFIHTGDQAKCDYFYLFRQDPKEPWIALVVDGKHTDCHTATLSGNDQVELIEAAILLKDALGTSLGEHRTLFFTNRNKETECNKKEYLDAVESYERTFDDGTGREVKLETIGQETFEFAPFSDILFMRRH